MKQTGMTVLITGGAGFIGSHMADYWHSKGASVIVVDNLSTGNADWVSSGIELIKLDLTKNTQLSKILLTYKPKIIHHFAGHTRLREALIDPVGDAKDNLLSTVSLIQACLFTQRTAAYQPEQIIFSSTSAVYAGSRLPPFSEHSHASANSPYGLSKLSAEAYLDWYHKLSKVTTTVLRYANVYGPRQSSSGEAGVVAKFVDALCHELPLTVFGDGLHQRDYIHVSDVITANAAVAKHRCQGTFVVGTGVPTKTIELAKICQKLRDTSSIVTVDQTLPEQARSWLDSSTLQKETGWKARVKLKDGLKDTLRWYDSYVQK